MNPSTKGKTMQTEDTKYFAAAAVIAAPIIIGAGKLAVGAVRILNR